MKGQPLKIVKVEHGNEYVPCPANEATHLKLNLPGPSGIIVLPVMIGGRREGTPNWTWNGSTEAPTLKPSVLSMRDTDWRCHSWITDGNVIFLPDSKHELAGKTVPLLDIV